MKSFLILFFIVLFLGLSLSSSAAGKPKDEKRISEMAGAAQNASKVNETEKFNREEVNLLKETKTEKSANKKRDVSVDFADKPEYADDEFYEPKSAFDDYDSIQALRSYLENSRGGNSALEPSRLRVNDLRYHDGESRRKRTPVFDGLSNEADNRYYEPEIRMTPEEVLLALVDGHGREPRIYNFPSYGRWNDVENSIRDRQRDLEGSEEEEEDFYRDRRFNRRSDRPINPSGIEKFTFGRKFLTNPSPGVPVYRRSIL